MLFSINKDLVNDWKAEKRFDLYYYDGLARQQEVIKLSICKYSWSIVKENIYPYKLNKSDIIHIVLHVLNHIFLTNSELIQI